MFTNFVFPKCLYSPNQSFVVIFFWGSDGCSEQQPRDKNGMQNCKSSDSCLPSCNSPPVVTVGITFGAGAGANGVCSRSVGSPVKNLFSSYLKLHLTPIILPPRLPPRCCGVKAIMSSRQLRQSAGDMSGVHCTSP